MDTHGNHWARQADVVQEFGKWLKKSPNAPIGGESSIAQFGEQAGTGPRALNNLRQQQGGGIGAPAPKKQPGLIPAAPKRQPTTVMAGVGPEREQVPGHKDTPYVFNPDDYEILNGRLPRDSRDWVTDGSHEARKKSALIAEPDFIWSKQPGTVHTEFAGRMASGHHPDDVFKQIIGEIADHCQSGQISNRDAHRAANEAFGRYLMIAKKRRANPVPKDKFQPRWDESYADRSQEGRPEPWRPEALEEGFGHSPLTVHLNPEYDIPSSRHPQVNKALTSQRKTAWQGWGPSTKALKHKIAGWEWDDHLNGFVSNSPRKFQCSCGVDIAVPDYHHCKCGKVWNTYVIGTGGDKHQASAEKFIAREIPVRENVIVASTDHFHDGDGRYMGPMKSKPQPDPFQGSDWCPTCGSHFMDPHVGHEPEVSKWGKRSDLQFPQDNDYSNDSDHQIENQNPFPSNHVPKRDTRSKGKSRPDWWRVDHASQQWVS